jgi:hypothetical protein
VEIIVYSLLSVFVFLLVYLAFSKVTQGIKILKFISGSALIALGVSGQQLTYVIGLSNLIDQYTFAGTAWQTTLFQFYSILGLAIIVLGIVDYMQDKTERLEE